VKESRELVQTIETNPSAHTNPYMHFLQSEFWGGLSGFAVYVMFHAAALGTEQIAHRWPMADPAPSIFFTEVLHWGGAIGGSMTFCIITGYQLIMLSKRLWAEVSA
jgi:hypothetical protein